MITDQEFSKLRTIIREEVELVVEEKLEQKLEEKLEQKLEEKLKPIHKKLNKIQKDLDGTIDFFDHEYMGHEKRITKIEAHLQLPQRL
ncbi:MAG: hypothetical protein ACD_61C00157G0002 [uncultured bacterium]|nr:MAG: hypothetical protein ACD_61C00157G0002 [uncultured bacterium]